MKKTSKVISICLAMTLIISTIFSTGAFAATPYVKSDTSGSVTLPQAYTYTFKMTTSGTNTAPSFTVGNSAVMEIYSSVKSGNNYYIKVIPTGGVGSVTGLYSAIPGQKAQLQCLMTVGESKLNSQGECLAGFEGSLDMKTYGGVTTSVYSNQKLVHEYAHTCVGDVDTVTVYGSGYTHKPIVTAFKKAHPDWKGHYWEDNVWYDKKTYDGKSTYEEVVAFCNGNASNIANLTQEHLYTLSGMINYEDNKTVEFCRKEFLAAWTAKMEWYVNPYAGWTKTFGAGGGPDIVTEDTSEPIEF